MARAIQFFIRVSIELLSISVIICKNKINIGVLIGMIFLDCPQDFSLLVSALCFKLDKIR